MHHTEIKAPGLNAWVNHNSDWSGECHVTWVDDDGEHRVVDVPGPILVALAKTIGFSKMRESLSSFFDKLEADDVGFDS